MDSSTPQLNPSGADIAIAMETGAVRALDDVNTSGMRYSFHIDRPTKATIPARPGAIRRSVILRKAPKREHPSIIAASSSSGGMLSINDLSSMIAILVEKATPVMTMGAIVSIKPRLLKIGNSGMITIIGGNMRIVSKNAAGTFSQ